MNFWLPFTVVLMVVFIPIGLMLKDAETVSERKEKARLHCEGRGMDLYTIGARNAVNNRFCVSEGGSLYILELDNG